MEAGRNVLRDFVVTALCAFVPPSILTVLYHNDVITLATLKIGTVIFFILFVVFPLIYKYSYGIQQSMVFLNFVNLPKNPDYANPTVYGLEGVNNLYLTADDDVKLGVWQILPEKLLNGSYTKEYYDAALRNGQNVVIYNHGNSGNRAAPHRVELYKVLRRHFHVIAYDYRGYGDSSDINPTEQGLVKDCKFIYKWVSNMTSGKIFVWGHSLGTSLSTHTLAVLGKENIIPAGLILESPFNNMREEISEHPLASVFKLLPWFHYTVVEPMQENNFVFSTDKYILIVDCPILILHAEDDRVVPFKLGYKLYKMTLEHRRNFQGSIRFHRFLGQSKYGHKYICRAPELLEMIREFETTSMKEAEEKRLL